MSRDKEGIFRDRLRLILLLDACEVADITPVPIMKLHALAFLANVLSPVWSINSYEGKILKRKGGPYYPELQRQLDRMVGLGLVTISDVSHSLDDNRWRLEGSFALNTETSAPLVDASLLFSAERAVSTFLRRLAIASTQLSAPVDQIVRFDATWSDQRTGVGDVIDFSEWQKANYTAYAVSTFDSALPKGIGATRGDKVQIYMRYLENRSNAK